MTNKKRKNKTTAALLAVLLGWFGAHKFYLGKVWLGVVYLVFSWTLIPYFFALIDFLFILLINNEKFNLKYNQDVSFLLLSTSDTKDEEDEIFRSESVESEQATKGFLGSEKTRVEPVPSLSKKDVALNRKMAEKNNAAMQARRDSWDLENKRQPKRGINVSNPIVFDPPTKLKRAKNKRLDEVEFSYLDTKSVFSNRNVIVHSVENACLNGFDLNRGAVRTFRMDRIQGLIVSKDSGELFTVDEFVNYIKYC